MEPDEREERGERKEPTGEFSAKKIIIAGAALLFILLATYFGSGIFLKAKEKSDPAASPSPSAVATPSTEASPSVEAIPNADATPETGENCPVCKVQVDPANAEFRHHVKETNSTVYFDREECYRKFLDNPYKYLGIKFKYKIVVKLKPSPTPEKAEPLTGGESPVPDAVPDTPAEGPPTPESVPDSGKPQAEPPAKPPGDVGEKASKPPCDATAPGAPCPATPTAKEKKPKSGGMPDFDIPPGAIPPEKKAPAPKTAPPAGGGSHSY